MAHITGRWLAVFEVTFISLFGIVEGGEGRKRPRCGPATGSSPEGRLSAPNGAAEATLRSGAPSSSPSSSPPRAAGGATADSLLLRALDAKARAEVAHREAVSYMRQQTDPLKLAKAEVEVAKAKVEVAKAEVEVAEAKGDGPGRQAALLACAMACEGVKIKLRELDRLRNGSEDVLIMHFEHLRVNFANRAAGMTAVSAPADSEMRLDDAACDILRAPLTARTVLQVNDERFFIFEEHLEALRLWETTLPHMILIGTPGIGKSKLATLASYRCLALGFPVIRLLKDSAYLLRRQQSGAVAREVLPSLQCDRWNLRTRGLAPVDVVVIFDGRDGFHATCSQDARIFRRVLVVHSPSGHFINSEKSDAVLHIMEPTSCEQLHSFRENFHSDVSEELLNQRMEICGPSLRPLFRDSPSSLEYATNYVKSAVDQIVGLGVDGLNSVGRTERAAHRIVVLHRQDGKQVPSYSFASEYIRDRVVSELAATSEAALLQLANTADVHGSLRGQVFEHRMLDYLGRSGATLEFEQLDQSGTASMVTIAVAGREDFDRLDDVASVQPGVLYRPRARNFPSIDAFILAEQAGQRTLYLVQTTVAAQHSVLGSTLAAVAERVRQVSPGARTAVALVFLVPPVVSSRFLLPQGVLGAARQPLTTATMNPTYGRQVKWVLRRRDDALVWGRER